MLHSSALRTFLNAHILSVLFRSVPRWNKQSRVTVSLSNRARAIMAERRLSKRSQRRLRQIVAQRLAVQPPKKPRVVECSDRGDPSPSDRGDTKMSSHSDSHDDLAEPSFFYPGGTQMGSRSDSHDPSASPGLTLTGLLPSQSSPDMDSEVGHSGVGEGGEGGGHSGVGEGGEGEGHSGVGEGGEGHSGEDSTCSGTLEEDASIMSSDSSELVNDSSSGDDLSGDSSDSNSDCEDISNDSTDDPLYPGSCITDHSFNTVFMSIVQRHNLTYASQSDLLKFFSLTLPSPSKVPPSSMESLSILKKMQLCNTSVAPVHAPFPLGLRANGSSALEPSSLMQCLCKFLYKCS